MASIPVELFVENDMTIQEDGTVVVGGDRRIEGRRRPTAQVEREEDERVQLGIERRRTRIRTRPLTVEQQSSQFRISSQIRRAALSEEEEAIETIREGLRTNREGLRSEVRGIREGSRNLGR